MTQPTSTLVPSRALPLAGSALRVDARGGIARVVLEQRFVNPHAEALAVTYTLPLPADGAVSGYAFRVGDRVIRGQVDKKQRARERFEEAIARGHTAALLEQERSSLFTQELGNIPPGAEVTCSITIDQRLAWLDEGEWEFRFPLAAAPRYLGEAGRVADAAKVAFDVAESVAARVTLAMSVRDALVPGRSPESPSHALQVAPDGAGFRVELGGGGKAQLDRDVVVRWAVAQRAASVTLDSARGARGDAYALVTIVPPAPDARPEYVARDLVVLLDTSGSMGGAPLDQARRVASALVDGLTEKDTVELIEFSNSPRRFRASPLAVTRDTKKAALAWIAALRASGGTEMREGILEALRPLREDAQRQIVLVTDGLIGFEQEIVAEVLNRLPAASRVHTVGVGSSVNRSLTGPVARAGHGVEVVIGLGEDPERATRRILSRTAAPIVVDLALEGDAILETVPSRLPDLFGGAPAMIAARVRPEGGTLVVRGRTAHGAWEQRVRLDAPIATSNDAIAKLYAREAVEDAETKIASGEGKRGLDAEIERLGLEHQIATRLTSWVAIDTIASVDPTEPTRREDVPQMLPFGLSAEGLGLRSEAAEMNTTRAGTISPAGMEMLRRMQAASGAAASAPSGAPTGAPPPPRSAAPMPPPPAMARPASPAKPMGAPPAPEAPPPAQGAPRRKQAETEGGGLYEKAKRAFEGVAKGIRDRFESADDEADISAAMEPEAEEATDEKARSIDLGALGEAKADRAPSGAIAGPAGGRTLRGRLVLHRAASGTTELVVEITIDAALGWDPVVFACILHLSDGRAIAVTIDPTRTTKRASLGAGHAARLALHAPLELAREAVVRIDLMGDAGGPIMVVLV